MARDDEKKNGAYQAGKSFGDALKVTRAAPRGLLNAGLAATGITGAMKSAVDTTAGFTRGLAGAAPAPTATPAAAQVQRRQPAAPTAPPATGGMDFSRPAPPPPRNLGGVLPNAPKLAPGDPNTFTGANGATRSVPYQAAAAGVANPGPARVPDPVVASQSPAAGFVPRGAQGAAIEIPGEARRRLEIDLATLGRGSPSVRRALIDQYGAGQQRSFDANQAVQNAQRGMDAQGARDAAAAQQQFAGDRLDAAKFSQGSRDAREARASDGQQINRTLSGADGTVAALRNDGSLTPVTGPDGKPFRERAQASEGAITPKAQLDFLGEQRKSIMENIALPAEERTAALAQIDQQVNALLGQKVQHAKPTIEQFLAAARQANPGATDEQLSEFYRTKYGQ